jgi:hypothetical protein
MAGTKPGHDAQKIAIRNTTPAVVGKQLLQENRGAISEGG